MKTLTIAFVLVTGLAICARCQTVNFFNGGFENYNGSAPGVYWDPIAHNWLNVAAGSTALTGWRVAYGNVDILMNGLWQTPEGVASLDMNGYVPGGIEQDVTFTSASQYYIDFMLSKNPATSYADLGVWCKPPGASAFIGLGLFSFNTQNSFVAMHWTLSGTPSFAVVSGTYIFAFGSVAPDGNAGPALDEVNLVPGTSPFGASPDPGLYPGTVVPEPGPSALVAALAMLGFVSWRRLTLGKRLTGACPLCRSHASRYHGSSVD